MSAPAWLRSAPARLVGGLARNVLGGFRIALGLPLRRSLFRISASDYAVLAIFNLVVWIVGSALRAGGGAEFNPDALPGLALNVPVTLLVCLLLSRLFRDDSLLLAFAVALASTDLLFEIVGTATFLLFEGPWSEASDAAQLGVYAVYVGWGIACVLRTQALLAPWRPPRSGLRSGLAAVLLTAMVLGLAYMPRDEPWGQPSADQDQDDGDDPAVIHEQIYHVRAARPQASGWMAVQFVKVAGKGSRYARADTDGNGLLSRDEVARALPRLARDFDAIDTNHDGQLSPQEIRAWQRAHRNTANGERFEAYFHRADSDGDGRLSRAEAEANLPRVAAKFDAIDANHDGFISLEEMRAWLTEKRRSLRQQTSR
jgi:hypothetical protein